MPTIVSGFGRCGTTLVMHMLAAGGAEVVGRRPAYEVDQAARVPIDLTWLSSCGEAAVKVLDPQRSLKSVRSDVRVIWLDRNPEQQARSQVKFLRQVAGVPIRASAWKRLARSFSTDRQKVDALFANSPVLKLSFEAVLSDPLGAAREMTAYFPGLDVERAAAVVQRRPASCAPGMSVEIGLMR